MKAHSEEIYSKSTQETRSKKYIQCHTTHSLTIRASSSA